MIRKVIIPAAGLGTRFLPITKAIPKEMLPIVDKPCIQYIVEEAIKNGIRKIIIITNNNKQSIKDYFPPSKKFTYVKQPKPLGDGHAILCAKHLVKNEPFAVLFGDDIYDSTTPPLTQMLKAYKKYNAPIIGLQKIPKKDSSKYGIIEPSLKKGKIYKIKSLIEKPTPQKAPSNLAIVGKYIVTPDLLKALTKAKSNTKDKELRLADGMIEYLKKGGDLYGIELEGQRFDTGDKAGYLKAIVHFAKKSKII